MSDSPCYQTVGTGQASDNTVDLVSERAPQASDNSDHGQSAMSRAGIDGDRELPGPDPSLCPRCGTLVHEVNAGAIHIATGKAACSANGGEQPKVKPPMTDALDRYVAKLDRQAISEHTRRAYRGSVRRYLTWLQGRPISTGALVDPMARDFAVRDFRRELKDGERSPATVNATLAALDDFYRSIGLGPADVDRDRLPARAPRALSDQELRTIIRAALRVRDDRATAAIALMAFAGLRVGELVRLDVDDVTISARGGSVVVHRGKGDSGRRVPLGAEARRLVDPWRSLAVVQGTGPLFPGPGGRLSTRGVDRMVARLGAGVGVTLSPHTLRHTFVTRLIRSGADVVLVAELAGHRSLETTRRYALPTQEDRESAVEGLGVDP
jgi:site-specific recombinase XerD